MFVTYTQKNVELVIPFSSPSFMYGFCAPFGSVTSGLRRPSALASAVAHAAALAVNAALRSSQWQRRA